MLFDRRWGWDLPVDVHDFARERERTFSGIAKLLQPASRGLELPFESDPAESVAFSSSVTFGAQLRQQERDLIVLLRSRPRRRSWKRGMGATVRNNELLMTR